MSKTKEKGKEKEAELLSIAPKKTAKLTVIDTTKQTTPLTSTSLVEENDIVSSAGVQSTEIINEPVVENLVYELVFAEGGKEKVIYTKINPQFSAKHILKVEDAFGKEDFKEVVLGRREVKACCYKPLEQDIFELDLRKGVLLKVLAEQPWMNTEYAITKRTFDESVLKAYRELSTTPITPAATGIPADKTSVKQPVKQQQNQGTGFGVGNLPVDKNRPKINEF